MSLSTLVVSLKPTQQVVDIQERPLLKMHGPAAEPDEVQMVQSFERIEMLSWNVLSTAGKCDVSNHHYLLNGSKCGINVHALHSMSI